MTSCCAELVPQLVTRIDDETADELAATEIALGTDEGLDLECAASFDNLGPQPVSMLTRRIGRLHDARSRIRHALAALADC